MEELRNVNLSKFVSEAVASICEAKLRASDIQAAVQVRCLLIYCFVAVLSKLSFSITIYDCYIVPVALLHLALFVLLYSVV